MPQALVASSHQVDHIVGEKHNGRTTADNLALSCTLCNLRKGSDIASFDPETNLLTPLFNPRTQAWREHFVLSDGVFEGITDVGRTTEHFLRLNTAERIMERAELLRAGVAIDAHILRKPR